MPVRWENGALSLLDQNLLPRSEGWVSLTTWAGVADAIARMTVRGAPAIGVAAAYGVALAAREAPEREFDAVMPVAIEGLRATRPTAVNLFWALDRMERTLEATIGQAAHQRAATLLNEAHRIAAEDLAANRALGAHGATLLNDGDAVLTHCNPGALATSGYGTALGVIRAATDAGKRLRVFADETRPRLQGLKLTAWELMRDGVEVTVIADGASGSLMRAGRVQAVVVGADRIAANGDVANKIGTYNVAVIARHHDIPFYVAAPFSTVDANTPTGDDIRIEERDPGEITHLDGEPVGPEGVPAWNPAFDITPARLVTAIITERGVLRPPYRFTRSDASTTEA